MNDVGHEEGLARDAKIVVDHCASGDGQHTAERQEDPLPCGPRTRRRALHQPDRQGRQEGHAQHEALVRSAVREDHQADAEDGTVPRPRPAHDPPERAEREGASEDRHQPAPVALAPQDRQVMRDGEHSARERPPAGHPAGEHPRERGAREPGAEPHAGDREPERDLPERHHQALRRRILRCVGRLVDDVRGLEVHPQRVRRVRQPAVRERVGGQEVAELVGDVRLRDPDEERDRDARCHRQRPDQARGEEGVRRQASAHATGRARRGPAMSEPREGKREQQGRWPTDLREGPREGQERQRAAGEHDRTSAPAMPDPGHFRCGRPERLGHDLSSRRRRA